MQAFKRLKIFSFFSLLNNQFYVSRHGAILDNFQKKVPL